jgi:hypothetical protein
MKRAARRRSCSSASSIVDLDDVALLQVPGVAQEDFAVDLGRIGLAAAGGAVLADFVDDHFERAADLGLELGGADRRGLLHDPG